MQKIMIDDLYDAAFIVSIHDNEELPVCTFLLWSNERNIIYGMNSVKIIFSYSEKRSRYSLMFLTIDTCRLT